MVIYHLLECFGFVQSGVAIKTAKRQETQDDDDEDDDEASDLQGRTTTAAGQEVSLRVFVVVLDSWECSFKFPCLFS